MLRREAASDISQSQPWRPQDGRYVADCIPRSPAPRVVKFGVGKRHALEALTGAHSLKCFKIRQQSGRAFQGFINIYVSFEPICSYSCPCLELKTFREPYGNNTVAEVCGIQLMAAVLGCASVRHAWPLYVSDQIMKLLVVLSSSYYSLKSVCRPGNPILRNSLANCTRCIVSSI
jgi:hypothetical protein